MGGQVRGDSPGSLRERNSRTPANLQTASLTTISTSHFQRNIHNVFAVHCRDVANFFAPIGSVFVHERVGKLVIKDA